MTFKNQLKTVILLGALTGLLLGVGHLLAGPTGLVIGLVFALALNFGSYWFSDKIVLAIYKAKEIKKEENPSLHHLVEEISYQAQIPQPKVCLIPTPQPNAFACGRNPQHAVVACTSGILQLLNKEELKGVLAHEISHIKNRDILISSIAATIAGVISYIAMIARFGAIFGGFGGRGRGNLFELLALAIITPIIALLIQLAISRSREYLADESAAHLTKQPSALASALQKIHASIKHHPLRPMATTKSTAHLFIANPFRSGGLVNLFSTHPSLENRLKRLHTLKI